MSWRFCFASVLRQMCSEEQLCGPCRTQVRCSVGACRRVWGFPRGAALQGALWVFRTCRRWFWGGSHL